MSKSQTVRQANYLRLWLSVVALAGLGLSAFFGWARQAGAVANNSPARDNRFTAAERNAAPHNASHARQPLPDTRAVAGVFVVTNENDSGPGSLRQAIQSANATPEPDMITFGTTFAFSENTIRLRGAELAILGDTIIEGPRANLLTISGESASRVFYIGSGATVNISGVTIAGGNADTGINTLGSFGGGIENQGNLTLTQCHITGNRASAGGGIRSEAGAVLQLKQSTVSNNTATQPQTGAGIDSAGQLLVNTATISGNLGPNALAGGILSSGSTTILSSTITNNFAAGANSAGGVNRTNGSINIFSSIIAGNVNNAAVPDVIATGNPGITSNGFNLIGNPGTVAFIPGADQRGTASAPLDPLLGPLTNNGGSLPTHALLGGSPALDQGLKGPETTDQRLLPRSFNIASIPKPSIGGDETDVGAFESQAIIVRNGNNSGVDSLRQALTDANANADLNDIIFDTPGLITLTSELPAITQNLTLTGRADVTRALTAPDFRIFTIAGNVGSVTLSWLNISSGRAVASGPGGFGGGILSQSPLTLNECTISRNEAVNGGGVFVFAANATFTGCTFSGNRASTQGGGIDFQGEDLRRLRLFNCTVSGNSATSGKGGGIFNHSTRAGGEVEVVNSTIANNTNANGGGISTAATGGATATTTLRNTIVANNTAPNLAASNDGGVAAVVSRGFNLTSDSGFLNGTGDQVSVNPLLGPLRNNGGRTETHALLNGSPALDTGHSSGFIVDQRGAARAFNLPGITAATGGDSADIGAFESQEYVVANTALNGPGSLREALLATNLAVGAAVISFDSSFFNTARTLNLTAPLPEIRDSVEINGPGANLLNITRNTATPFRIFTIPVAGLRVTMRGLTLSNGEDTEFGGGGIASASRLDLTDCAITNNKASVAGGGIFLTAGGVFSGCTISGNTAGVQGGGVSFQQSKDGILEVLNCTVSGNRAGGNAAQPELSGLGAGIFNFALGGSQTLSVFNCTIANNTGTNVSGGIGTWTDGSAGTAQAVTQLYNSIIANNAAPNLRTTIVKGGGPARVVSGGYNLTNDNGGGFLDGPGDQINANPLLGPLRNNGGPTATHALLAGSPALDKGKNQDSLTTDQRGVRRPIDDPSLPNPTGGDGSDIGAFERSAPAVVAAATFKLAPLAQESIVAVFGENIATGTASATTIPLPNRLLGTGVAVVDSRNFLNPAPLFFVSPGQINFQIPPGVATGAATILILLDGNVVASTTTIIAAVEPGLFTANANGQGVPAAFLIRARASGGQVREEVARLENGVFVPVPINLGPAGDQLFLILFGSGLRNRSSLNTVTLNIGNAPALGVDFAGAQGLVGLDQINSKALPRSLAGAGTVNVQLTVDGKPANVVTLNYQ